MDFPRLEQRQLRDQEVGLTVGSLFSEGFEALNRRGFEKLTSYDAWGLG